MGTLSNHHIKEYINNSIKLILEYYNTFLVISTYLSFPMVNISTGKE